MFSVKGIGKKTKIRFVIIALIVIIGGVFVMRKKAEEYILREAKIGLKIYFEKYYSNVDLNSIKVRIKYRKGMASGPVVKGYVNDDKNLWFTCNVIKVPRNKMNSKQSELGMVVSDSGMSGKLDDKLKYEYSFHSSYSKTMKNPSELIPKPEVEKAKKNRYLLNFIPEMMHY